MPEEKPPHNGSEHASGEAEIIGLPIRHRVLEGQPLVFANSMVIQHTADEFILSFFQISPPVITGAPADQRRQMEELEGIDAYCVARIVMTPAHMARVVDTTNANWRRYLEAVQAGTGQDEEAEE